MTDQAPDHTPLVDDGLKAELDERFQNQMAAYRARLEARKAARAEFARRRLAGKETQHAAKLARTVGWDRPDGQNGPQAA